jgi:hypothetical protein
VGEKMEVLPDDEAGVEEAPLLPGREGAGDHLAVAPPAEHGQAVADGVDRRRRRLRDRRQVGDAAIAAPAPGPEPLAAVADDVDPAHRGPHDVSDGRPAGPVRAKALIDNRGY